MNLDPESSFVLSVMAEGVFVTVWTVFLCFFVANFDLLIDDSSLISRVLSELYIQLRSREREREVAVPWFKISES